MKLVFFKNISDFREVANPRYSDYTLVAMVKTSDLDIAYKSTNHIYSNWTTNKNVVSMSTQRCRSCSIGDLIFCTETNKWFMVSFLDFKEVTPFFG